MNKLEKKSFRSFLLLYLLSSLMFLSLVAYWYFKTQKLSIENIHYYKMQHVVDKINRKIIMAHMQHKELSFDYIVNELQDGDVYLVGFFDNEKNKLGGNLDILDIDFNHPYYQYQDDRILISTGSNDHLGIHYVVLSNKSLPKLIRTLSFKVYTALFLSFLLVGMIGWRLSKMFLKPIREKMDEVERFIKDITHELNTPITALMLSSKRLKEKGSSSEKAIRNISISTKQLFDMYQALAFTSFSHASYKNEKLSFSMLVEESLSYFDELLTSKRVKIETHISSKELFIDRQKATMLINNIISNAIKYSMPESSITITLNETKFVVSDEGIGIEADKLDTIFNRFTRASSYSGGFGVGLSVVKHICDDYGFKVDVISKIDVGTTVEVIF